MSNGWSPCIKHDAWRNGPVLMSKHVPVSCCSNTYTRPVRPFDTHRDTDTHTHTHTHVHIAYNTQRHTHTQKHTQREREREGEMITDPMQGKLHLHQQSEA